uniref:RNase H type-1 domain-containing protein n=1 Tax=Fagus sylvatica TaxID=28930 RepID=A0A2N9H3S2_FAGSY
MLIWRIASEILPTRTVVAHKLGLGDTSCPLCLDCKESIVHLFLKCLVPRAIWFGLRWAIHSSQFMVTNNKDIIKMVVHNGFKFNISGTIQQLEARIEENIRSFEDIEPDVVGTRLLNVKWIAPDVGTIKLNVDAAISKGKAVIIVVARNHHGDLIKAWARQTKPLDPTLAEATAINWALEIALGDNFNYICIESDAKVCIDALFSKSEDFL